MNQNDLNTTVNEVLSATMEAEQKGVAVDWKQTCMTVCNAASNYIAACEKKINALEYECASAGLRETGDGDGQ